jgi:hypothetical protein
MAAARAEDRVHPLVPPLALAVITLIGAAVVIVAGHPETRPKTTTTTAVPHPVGRYGGGKTSPRGRRRAVRPVKAPLWVSQELGRVDPSAPLVRKVGGSLRVTLTRRGFVLEYRGALLARYDTRLGRVGRVVRHRFGLERSFRRAIDATVVRGSVTSSYLVVGRHRGLHTWTWRLQTNLRPRVRADGALLLEGTDSLLVLPPRIYDRTGRNVTPRRLRWRLRGAGNAFVLSVQLDDGRLSIPYVISG